KGSQRKCEFDQMREVPFVPKADGLALATSHLARSSSASRVTAAQAGQSGERPERSGQSFRFETMPSRPSLHAWRHCLTTGAFGFLLLIQRGCAVRSGLDLPSELGKSRYPRPKFTLR